jgi:hypothetical protein
LGGLRISGYDKYNASISEQSLNALYTVLTQNTFLLNETGLSKTSPREYLRSISSSLQADEACLQYLESEEEKYWDPASEDEQADPILHRMSQEAVKLAWVTVCSRPEEKIAVVTHWGVR